MFVLASLLTGLLSAAAPEVPTLLLVPNEGTEEIKVWKQVADSQKWRFTAAEKLTLGDAGVKSLETVVEGIRKESSGPVYLIGAGPNAAFAFYAGTRAPHLFDAVLAVGGSPKPAIETDRLFAINTSLLPIAWALTPEDRQANSTLFQRLTVGGFQIEVLESADIKTAVEWLSKHRHNPWPLKIDCETGNPNLARCYWVTPTEFDPKLRNDALRSTRIAPDNAASLEFGPFGYRPDAPGPGVLVEYLPPNYSGPLQLKDRIVALSGAPIADPRHYLEKMSQVTEEKPVAVTIERDKERIRLVTRYQLRQRVEVITARLQAEYLPDAKEITIVSRTVASAKVQIPTAWIPATINWNGTPVVQADNAGCWIVSIKNPGQGRPCD